MRRQLQGFLKKYEAKALVLNFSGHFWHSKCEKNMQELPYKGEGRKERRKEGKRKEGKTKG